LGASLEAQFAGDCADIAGELVGSNDLVSIFPDNQRDATGDIVDQGRSQAGLFL
jgi:hypothetical protein